jgi:hypothetical protein
MTVYCSTCFRVTDRRRNRKGIRDECTKEMIFPEGINLYIHSKYLSCRICVLPGERKYEGKSISKLQMDIELKQIRVLIWKILSFLSILSLYIEALVPSFHKPLKTSSITLFGLLSEPGGDFPFYSFIVGKMFSRKLMFKKAEQMEIIS